MMNCQLAVLLLLFCLHATLPLRAEANGGLESLQRQLQLQALLGQIQGRDPCSQLRSQNAVLTQLLLGRGGASVGPPLGPARSSGGLGAFGGGGGGGFASPDFAHQPRDLRAQQQLLENALTSSTKQFKSVLVTPKAEWDVITSSEVYETLVTHTISSEIPIIFRGQKKTTTIVEYESQLVNATKIKTSSLLVTPSPTWTTIPITTSVSTNTKRNSAFFNDLPTNEIISPQPARVEEIQEPKRKREFFSAQRRHRHFSNSPSFRNGLRSNRAGRLVDARRPHGQFPQKENRKPVVVDLSGYDYDYEYEYDDYDQQVLAAQADPVFVPAAGNRLINATRRKSSRVRTSVQSTTSEVVMPTEVTPTAGGDTTKTYTLYITGKKPGFYTTQLTTVVFDAEGKRKDGRSRRSAGENPEAAIEPSKPQPIFATRAPSLQPSETPSRDREIEGSHSLRDDPRSNFVDTGTSDPGKKSRKRVDELQGVLQELPREVIEKALLEVLKDVGEIDPTRSAPRILASTMTVTNYDCFN